MEKISSGLYAKITGHGPHIVFLHGLNVTHRCWGDEFPKQFVNANYSVVQFDMPGFGRSAMLDDLAPDSAKKIIAYLETLPKPVILIGHSYGGGVAIMIAAKRPDLVEKLVLIAPGGSYPSPRAIGRLEWLDERLATVSGEAFRRIGQNEAIPRLFTRKDPQRAKHLAWDPTHTPEAIRSIAAAHVDKHALEITAPTLLFWGTADKVIFPTFMKRLAKLTGWETHTLPKTGHLLFLDQPQECAKIILEWLKR